MPESSLFRRIKEKAAELAAEDYSRKSTSELEAILRDPNSSHMLRSIAERVLARRGVTTREAGSAAPGIEHQETAQGTQAFADGTGTSDDAPTREGWYASLASYVRGHWRGELPMAETIGNILLLGWLLDEALSFGHSQRWELADTSPLVAASGMLFLHLASLLILTWQVVGVWRFGTRQIAQTRKRFSWRGIQLSFVLMAATFVLPHALVGVPFILHFGKEAFGLLPYQQYQVNVVGEPAVLLVSGGIGPGLSDAVENELDRNPGVKLIILESIGGEIREAKTLHDMISMLGLVTSVRFRCYSACTVAFLAGRERVLHEDATLAFHAPRIPAELDPYARLRGAEYIDAVKEKIWADTRRVFVQAGVDPTFVRSVLALRGDKLWAPSHEELLRARVITATVASK